MHEEFSKIDDALQALREGRVIIVVDDEDRENEGDFVAAAEKVTPEMIEFMITHGRGLVCMPILPELAARLHLGPMVERNTAPHQTPYTVPVDHRSCRTGISAQERARTVRAIIDPATRARRPGPSRPPVSAGGQGWRRASPRRAHRGDRRSGPAGRPDAGRRPLRDPRRHGRRQPRSASCDLARARAADRFDRVADQVPPPARKAGQPGRRSRSADALRPEPDHRLPRSARARQRAGRDRHGRPADRSTLPWSGCIRRVLRAICSIRCGAIAATSFTWRCR